MKTRHLVLGLGLVLALALAVPALGGPLTLRSSSIVKMRPRVKKARKRASAARQLAGAAQIGANAAQNAAAAAQAEAAAAQSAANDAQNAAAAAQSAANDALGKANDAAGRLATVEDTVGRALVVAGEKATHTIQRSEPGATAGGENRKVAEAECPAGTFVSGGGFAVGQNSNIRVFVNEPAGNGWAVEAASQMGPFTITAWAVCLAR